jgi:hypothetical protein
VINLTTSDEDDLAIYPSTLDFLTELHCLWLLCNYPQYYDKLSQHGIFYVDSLLKLDPTFFSDIIGIPAPAVDAFMAYVKKVNKRAKKGKTPLCHIKREDTSTGELHVNNNKENIEDWEF